MVKDLDSENGVGPRALMVHLCGGIMPAGLPLLQDSFTVLEIVYLDGEQSLHKELFSRGVLINREGRVQALLIQKIEYLLLIDLEVGTLNSEVIASRVKQLL